MHTTQGRHSAVTRWLGGGAVLLLLAVCVSLATAGNGGGVAAAGQFRVRVLMAVPDLAGGDVWIDSNPIANNTAYRTMTAYGVYTAGNYTLRVLPPGQTARSAAYVNTSFKFQEPKDYTIVVRGKKADNSINITVEIDRNAQDANTARVRFGNALNGSQEVTLSVTGANTVLGRAKFGETADYTGIAAGAYEVASNDGNGVIAKGNITLAANTVVSIFALGTKGSTDAAAPALLLVQDNPANGTGSVIAGGSAATATAPPVFTSVPAPTQAPLYNGAMQPAASGQRTGSAALRSALAPVGKIADSDSKRFFDATGHTLGGKFKEYWDAHGGLEQFGYPVSEEYMEVSATDGKTYVTQYFERARFELHPDRAGTPYEVQQGLLGRELLKLLGM